MIDHDKIAATLRRNFDLRDRVSSKTYLALYDEVVKLRAERDATIATARIAYDALWELNINNYDHDDVCHLNDGSVEAILILAPLIDSPAKP